MVSLQKVDRSMYEEVSPLLFNLNAQVNWRNIFDCNWQAEDYCGYGLFDGNEIVGFLGLIFSRRAIANRVENFCNIHSWIVKPQYRDRSLSLILPLLKLKDCTLTDLSPAPRAIEILQRLGFKRLDSKLRVLLPVSGRNKNAIEIVHLSQEKSHIAKRLSKQDFSLFQDHISYSNCNHLLIDNDKNYCYVIYTIVKQAFLSHCYIQYISNIQIFSQYSGAIRSEIMRHSRTPLVVVDSRLIASFKLPFSYDLLFSFPKLYKSSSLNPDRIDNLYSELILLNFSLIPNNLQELRGLWHETKYWHSTRNDS
ncbi:hypothetical protein H6G17_22915 [Chroococcidiopsis sp. FACHB-1243]|uniref:hypothetical protein n=1 Tax=Chroococcidiopsis sp. [FACHB-1243] TaxID=2692781 RepID=UPI00178616D0|nr:hypothetical protein [Chroococcidiopsis sp. [FACHB-1243]]MBD2308330.1 hypothetical protein [Chroococcidiopsis sp. [FACHB-1243]]